MIPRHCGRFPELLRDQAHHRKATGRRVGSNTNWVARILASGARPSAPLGAGAFETIPCSAFWVKTTIFAKEDQAAPGCRKRKTVELPLRYRKSRFSIRVVPTAMFDLFCRCAGRRDAGPQWKLNLNNNSGRSEFGKNCFFTTAIPPPAIRNAPTTMLATVYFFPHAPGDKMAKPLVSRSGIDPLMASFYGLISGRSLLRDMV